METKIYALCQRWMLYILLFSIFLQSCDKPSNPFLFLEKNQSQLDKINESTNQHNPVSMQEFPNKINAPIGNTELQEGMEKEPNHVTNVDASLGKELEERELEKKEAPKKQDKSNLITKLVASFQETWFKNSSKEETTKKQDKTDFTTNLVTSFQEAWFEAPSKAYESKAYHEIAGLANSDIHLKRILLFYPPDVDTPEKKFGRYRALIECYKDGTAEPYLSKKENKAKIARIEKEINFILKNDQDRKCEKLEKILMNGGIFLKKKQYKMAETCFLQAKLFPEALNNLGFIYEKGYTATGKPNYQKAADYYEQAKTTFSFYNLGNLYMWGHIGKTEEIPDYQKAVKYFELSGHAAALHHLAMMYYDGHVGKVDEQPNYEKAKEYFEKSDDSDALHSLAMMYYDGHVGKIDKQPNYDKAKEYFQKSDTGEAHYYLGKLYAEGHIGKNIPQPDYEQAKSCFEISYEKGYVGALDALGILYMKGYVGKINDQPNYKLAVDYFTEATKLPKEDCPEEAKDIAFYSLGLIYLQGHYGCKGGKPDYQKAMFYFNKSKLPISFYKIASLYEEGNLRGTPTENYKKALDYYSKSTLPEAKLAILWLYQERMNELGLSAAEQEEKIDTIINQINDLLPTLSLNEAFYIKGLAAYYIDNLEDALKYLQCALMIGSEEEEISNLIQEIELELEQEKAMKHLLGDKAEEDNNSILPTVSITPPITPVVERLEENSYEAKQLLRLELISSLETKTIEKVTPIVKTKKKARKLKHTKLKVREAINAHSAFNQKISSHVEFLFVGEKEKKEFTTFKESNTKLGELLKDIAQNGWRAKGVGKPEVLKRDFKGYKGCISRRINQEDRIVYKPLEQGKVLILAWEGHYE